MRGNFAILKPESPFFRLFPGGWAPVKNSLVPSLVSLEGSDETQAYLLAVDRCTPTQLDQLAELVAVQFGGTKREVQDSLAAGIEMPIRLSQVAAVTTNHMAFL